MNFDSVTGKSPEQRRRMLLDAETRFSRLRPARPGGA
jgi:hypothetical protein